MDVDIEDSIYDRLERRADRNEFESTREYVNVVLAEFLDEIESEDDPESTDDDQLQRRLEDLGYL